MKNSLLDATRDALLKVGYNMPDGALDVVYGDLCRELHRHPGRTSKPLNPVLVQAAIDAVIAYANHLGTPINTL